MKLPQLLRPTLNLPLYPPQVSLLQFFSSTDPTLAFILVAICRHILTPDSHTRLKGLLSPHTVSLFQQSLPLTGYDYLTSRQISARVKKKRRTTDLEKESIEEEDVEEESVEEEGVEAGGRQVLSVMEVTRRKEGRRGNVKQQCGWL